ncbi:Spx/MgsR family RNA polymerase-binding regulatory protein [Halomonas cerina]|uniref:Spx/MgsR family transcriptional regulator n=1 Tax=Halomonas cerina TaxID=447424 RepID=A0A839VAN7_9GAMM|nr:Spx/MgsR family RNA polymerase-binding regulatory protein [Halomonas cerina]MBB3191148.1 Spx/MgsR family transcriptional regulator [Halomonas cerina]
MPTLYVIKSCDTCRRARQALEAKDLDYRLHDLRKDGLSADLLAHFLAHVPMTTLLNKRSTTWRQLDDGQKAGLDDADARVLLLAYPTLLKRPLLDTGETLLVGYRDGDYDSL